MTVRYALLVFGDFQNLNDNPWLPSSINETASMEMTDWKLNVMNEGADVKNVSCIGEGEFDAGNLMNIDVKRTNN